MLATPRLRLCILAAGVFLVPAASSAAPITITNASFEANSLACAAGPLCFDPNVPGWSITSGFSVVSTWEPGAGSFANVPDGVNVLAIGNLFGGGSASQTLTSTLTANTTYTLNVDVGNRADYPLSLYTRELLAGGNLLGSISNGVAPLDGQFLIDTLIFSTGDAPVHLGEALGIRISATGRTGANGEAQADFDNVRLDATVNATSVPEPSTLSLVALGLAACYRRHRRARR